MNTLIVTDQKQEWLEFPDAAVLTARLYLAERESGREVRVLNLCRTVRYQGLGYRSWRRPADSGPFRTPRPWRT